MKVIKLFLIYIGLLTLVGCHTFDDSLIYHEFLPFGKDDLENDISRNKNDLPKKIKKIIQYSGDTIMNIIEYDNKGNEVFKLYKQYIGEFWNGKYITMIRGNVFENGKLVSTYYFHSNIGFSWFSYQYGIFNQKVDIKEIKGSNYSINSNPFKKIDTLKSLSELLSHKRTDSLHKLTAPNYSLLWKHLIWKNKVEEEYISKEESCVSMSHYDEKGRLVKEVRPYGNINLYNYSKDGLTDYYEIKNKIDTSRTKKIRYNKEGLIDTLFIDQWIYTYKYEKGKVVQESIFNGDICISITSFVNNNLGYPIIVNEKDCNGKIEKNSHYNYKFEFFK